MDAAESFDPGRLSRVHCLNKYQEIRGHSDINHYTLHPNLSVVRPFVLAKACITLGCGTGGTEKDRQRRWFRFEDAAATVDR